MWFGVIREMLGRKQDFNSALKLVLEHASVAGRAEHILSGGRLQCLDQTQGSKFHARKLES